jgi:uncharacterized protein (TIGR02099 family)
VAGILLGVVKLLLRIALITGMVAYFVAGAGLLAARYWLLPQVDQWRPEIEQALSAAVGTPVRFDAISADWRGLNANLKITNLTILDSQGVAQLGVPMTDAIVSWRSLLKQKLVFRYIGVRDVVLVARRDPQGKIQVAGFELEQGNQASTSFLQSDTMQWLLTQGRLNIENARLVWIDQQRKAVPLAVDNIDLTVDNGLLGHKLDLKANLPEHWGGALEVVANIDSVQSSLSRLFDDKPDGYIYANVSELYPQAMPAWIDMPEIRGSFAGRLWLDFFDGKFTNFTLSLAGRDFTFKPTEFDEDWFTLGQFRWQASGPLSITGADIKFPDYVAASKSRELLASSLTLENSVFRTPASGMQPIQADQLSADVSLTRPAKDEYRLEVQDLAFANPDGLITARGSWALDQQGKGGRLDLKGTLARFKLPSLYRYLPDAIGTDAHDWLTTGFTAGVVTQASFEIDGMVDDFPFSSGRGPGTFRIDGSLQDWGVDYVSSTVEGELPWPPLANMNGTLNLLNDRIGVDITVGSLALPKGERINLSALSAELVDLEGDPVLTITAQTKAQADNYLALFKSTALRDIAPEFVRGFKGQGDWNMPLRLRVPLNDVEQTSFSGDLGFNSGSVSYEDGPPLTDIQGVALLTQKGFESQGISAKFLGGNIAIDGGVNEKLHAISGKGELAWPDVAKFAKSAILVDWLKGKMAYGFELTIKDDQFDFLMDSDLVGTQISLPAPFALSAGQSARTRIQWRGNLTGTQPANWSVSVANRLTVAATSLISNDANAKFFQRVNVALNSAKPLAGKGLTVSAELPTLDLDAWMPVVQTITRELEASSGKDSGLLPVFVGAKLQTQQLVMGGSRLKDVVADLSVKNARQYVLSLASDQANGSVQWAVDQGKLQDGIHVRLDRLEIGAQDSGQPQLVKEADRAARVLPESGALSNLPQLDIEIKDLTLYGVRLGELKLAGRNSSSNKEWQISSMQIVNPGVHLAASGNCRFDQDPGVTLDVEMKISDLGEMIKYMGFGERVRKGDGTLKANIQWARFPWRFDYSGLSGDVQINLEEGVFDHVNSSSARVLELLSLQSFNRVLNANINPGESFSQGFPWSSITASLNVKSGLIETQDATVNSPVATISISGKSNMVNETVDLDAVVRPNLDMSGTALATGFLINPIVGLSALVGQYLLRNPVEAVLSQRYHVTGTWHDPKVNAGASPSSQAEPANRQPEVLN